MSKQLRTAWMGAAWVVAATSIASACTATATVDLARRTRDRDDYRAARDVASEFIDTENSTKSTDTEKFLKDTLTLDAATGALMIEAGAGVSFGGTVYEAREKTAEGFRGLLDLASYGGHGYTADLQSKNAGTYETTSSRPRTDLTGRVSVREHMRQHVYEWDVWLKTGTEMYAGMTATAAEASRWEKGGDMYQYTYRGQQEGATAQPAPAPKPVASTPAPAPSTVEGPAPAPPPATRTIYFRIVPNAPAPAAPAPAPVEFIHHAG